MNNEQRLIEAKKQFDNLMDLPGSMPKRGVSRVGDPLTGFVDYNWKLIRDKETKRYKAFIEWVDLDGSGNRVVLPHEVLNALFRANESLIKQSRKEGAKQAVQTRKSKGILPFQKKSIIEQAEQLTEARQ